MSKRVSKAATQELTFLAALESVHADVDISKIAEIQDWSRAVRGKLYGAAVKDASDLSKLKAGLPSALGHPNATNEQYSEMAIPQLIAECTSESNESAWREFVRRFQPLVATVIAKVARRFGKVSHELVDDLTQETFLKLCDADFRVLRGVETRHENAFGGFLKVVATHTAHDYFRMSASVNRGAEQALELAPESSRGASSEPEKKVLVEEIEEILKTLSHEPNCERDYAIFWLYYRHGLTAKEIADLPGIKLSVKGVESTLHRLTQQISSALAQEKKKPK